MVIKAFIKELPEPGDNHYLVRIPFLEDNTNQESVFTSIMMHQPGGYGGYQVGDCVLVSFENHEMKVPIILGKLDVGEVNDELNTLVVDSLTVSSSVNLPKDTSFGGYSASDIFTLYQNISVLENRIKELEKKLGE